ncbi:MAG TPA: prepilin-type N-terminal cleavage/methylation domain-containing protein [Acidimicrobiales bacterium]|nr:prepilin-type N-terminal cleavage/methylation domain-containing protein [Acidimicrobiales bacterium]
MLNRRREEGFTLVEMMIVSLILAILLAVGGAGFVSLSSAASRNEDMVAAQQSVSTAMSQLERDIRSAETITVPPGQSPSRAVGLSVLQPDGTTAGVEWIYDPATATFTREVQAGSSYQPSSPTLGSVADVTFTYFDASGEDITATTDSNIAACTTAIGVRLEVEPAAAGLAPFQEDAEVALTNQLDALSSPGASQCGA